MERVN